jgi:hypothetical protein
MKKTKALSTLLTISILGSLGSVLLQHSDSWAQTKPQAQPRGITLVVFALTPSIEAGKPPPKRFSLTMSPYVVGSVSFLNELGTSRVVLESREGRKFLFRAGSVADAVALKSDILSSDRVECGASRDSHNSNKNPLLCQHLEVFSSTSGE